MPQHPMRMTVAQVERAFYVDVTDAGKTGVEARPILNTAPPLAAAPDAPIEPEPAPPTPPPTTASQPVRDAVIARRRPRKVSAPALTPPPPVTSPVLPTRH